MDIVWTGSHGESVLDIKSEHVSSMHKNDVTILSTGKISPDLSDAPAKILPAFLKPSCTPTAPKYNIISFDNDPPLLDFNTYLMMRVGRPQGGVSIQAPWKEPEEGVTTNWVPVAMVNWKVHMNSNCINPPCKTCNPGQGTAGWNLPSEGNYITPNEFINNFPLPMWFTTVPQYSKNQPLDPYAVPSQYSDGYYICLKGNHEVLGGEYELYDLG